MIGEIKYKLHFKWKNREKTVAFSTPTVFGVGLDDVVCILLFGSLIALISLSQFAFLPFSYLVGVVFYNFYLRGMVNAYRDETDIDYSSSVFNPDWIAELLKVGGTLFWPIVFILFYLVFPMVEEIGK